MTDAKRGTDWVEPYIERLIEFLGLQAWTWALKVETDLQGKHGTHVHKVDATCDPDWPYLHADITFDSLCWETMMSDPERRVAAKIIVCHEVLHILLAQLSHAMETIVNVYFPDREGNPSDETTAFTIYSKNEEHVVTRLSRQIYEALEREDDLRQRLRHLSDEIAAEEERKAIRHADCA